MLDPGTTTHTLRWMMDDVGGCGCCSGGGVVAKWERCGLPRDAFEVNQAPLFIA
ncbi:hypothetical protein HanHA89_Chr09g0344611 [Helianthus annuus]|nr:hypothetical protein HanHA89_Chr09g0344611 [Helianthus annuus]